MQFLKIRKDFIPLMNVFGELLPLFFQDVKGMVKKNVSLELENWFYVDNV